MCKFEAFWELGDVGWIGVEVKFAGTWVDRVELGKILVPSRLGSNEK